MGDGLKHGSCGTNFDQALFRIVEELRLSLAADRSMNVRFTVRSLGICWERGQRRKPVDNPFWRCFRVSGSELGLPTSVVSRTGVSCNPCLGLSRYALHSKQLGRFRDQFSPPEPMTTGGPLASICYASRSWCRPFLFWGWLIEKPKALP